MNGIKTNTKKPDWEQLNKAFTEKYNAEYASKTVNIAKLFIYYNNHREKFASAIVEYTEIYQDVIDLKTMNTNANYVLQYSSDKKELRKALDWCRSTLEIAPDNSEYQKTRDALIEKLKVFENEKTNYSNTTRVGINY